MWLNMKRRDDELYTTMFNALRHGVRRKVLRILSKRNVSFTTLLNELEISSSHLTYHLDALGELISKDESRYTLSVFGKAAVEMMANIEDPPRRYFENTNDFYKYAFTMLLTIFVVASALIVNLMDIKAAQQNILDAQEAKIESLTSELAPLRRFSELDTMVKTNSDVKVSSKMALSYFSYNEQDPASLNDAVFLIYLPENNRILEINLMASVPPHFVVPLSVQKGNALLNESSSKVSEAYAYNQTAQWMSKLVWKNTITDTEQSVRIMLSERGWYTISLVGPVVITEDGKPMIQQINSDTSSWSINEYMRIWADCRLLNGRDIASFGYMTVDPSNLLVTELR